MKNISSAYQILCRVVKGLQISCSSDDLKVHTSRVRSEGTMFDVFISYSRKDMAFAMTLCFLP
jgi:hypothetical protein